MSTSDLLIRARDLRHDDVVLDGLGTPWRVTDAREGVCRVTVTLECVGGPGRGTVRVDLLEPEAEVPLAR